MLQQYSQLNPAVLTAKQCINNSGFIFSETCLNFFSELTTETCEASTSSQAATKSLQFSFNTKRNSFLTFCADILYLAVVT